MYSKIFITYPNGLIETFSWGLHIIIGFVFVIFVICKRVKEGLGCLKEAYITLIWLSVAFPLVMMGGHSFVISPIVLTLGPVQGLLAIYVSLYYIFKCEVSLNYDIWQKK
eukprot:382105_1